MPSARRTIVIGRPPDRVFAFFTDHARDPSWRPNVKEIDPVGGAAAGTRVHQVVKGPGGRGIGADIEVTANEPPSRYAFQVVAGPVRPRGEFRFIETPNGTEVHFSLDAELGGIKKLLMSGSVQRSMDGEMAGLDTAKRLIESS
jgi:uncharacterized protein YndB with AHSA1/START domain